MEEIHSTALKILKHVGVKFHYKAALKIFENAGAVVNYQSENVRIDDDLVKYALDQTPSAFSMFDREMGKQYKWGDSELKLGTGGSVVNLLDSDGFTIRPPTTIDLIKMYQVADVLPEVSWTAPGSFVSDIPKEIAAVWRFYLRLKYGLKPSCADGIDLNDLYDNCELMEVVRSNSSDYAEKPFAIVQPCPQSPLSWSSEGVGCLFECANRNIPALILSMPFAGVTAPITMAGLLSQQCAEVLGGLVLLQLKKPGSRVVYGGGASHADMRDISNVMGSIYPNVA
jgi:trimethylamine--corrinoid protein Co-methyltransferase